MHDLFSPPETEQDSITVPEHRSILAIDIETYSEIDLAEAGVYRYASDESFALLLFAFAYDDGPVQLIDVASGDKFPKTLLDDLYNKDVIKTAFNATFERVCLSAFLNRTLSPEGWECTMVKSAMLGLPMALGQVAEVLHLPEQKDKNGKALIRYFCLPQRPTRTNGMRTRNLPRHEPERWRLFRQYCKQDVETERCIRSRLSFYAVPEQEKQLYNIDQIINDRGLTLDLKFVKAAKDMVEKIKEEYSSAMSDLTGLDNPKSVAQLKGWIEGQTGNAVSSLSKKESPDSGGNAKVEELLRLRAESAKTSNEKYDAMLTSMCCDGKVHGLLQFYGAGRTGRWAGRLVQVQNLPQNHLPDLDTARAIVKTGDYELAKALYSPLPDTLSQLIRTSFISGFDPSFPVLSVADFSAIEARVLAWLAGEQWRIDTFREGGDIYCASASKMFKVPVVKHGINGELRAKGKVAELALGYQGGVGALAAMGAEKMGMTDAEMRATVSQWRDASPAIVRLWDDVERAAKKAITDKTNVSVGKLTFHGYGPLLAISLPSGRPIFYQNARVTNGKIEYDGLNQTTRKWQSVSAYGGKLVENITQATARDLLANAMTNVHNEGYAILMHVHDEIIVETDRGEKYLADIIRLMCTLPSWAEGLPLSADGYQTPYYKKD